MSEINKALSQLATKHHATLEHIQAADVPSVTKRPARIWAIGGFGLSLAVGGWAVSQQASVVAEPIQASTSVRLFRCRHRSRRRHKNTHQPGEYLPRGQRGGHTADS